MSLVLLTSTVMAAVYHFENQDIDQDLTLCHCLKKCKVGMRCWELLCSWMYTNVRWPFNMVDIISAYQMWSATDVQTSKNGSVLFCGESYWPFLFSQCWSFLEVLGLSCRGFGSLLQRGCISFRGFWSFLQRGCISLAEVLGLSCSGFWSLINRFWFCLAEVLRLGWNWRPACPAWSRRLYSNSPCLGSCPQTTDYSSSSYVAYLPVPYCLITQHWDSIFQETSERGKGVEKVREGERRNGWIRES